MWGDAMMLERMRQHLGGSCAIWEDALTSGKMPSHLGGCHNIWEEVVPSGRMPSPLGSCHDIWEDATPPTYKLLFKIEKTDNNNKIRPEPSLPAAS